MPPKSLRELGGIRVYVGEPRTGKTYKAERDLEELLARTRTGALVIDSTGCGNWADKPHSPSAAHAVATAWHGGRAYFTPRSQEDFDRVIEAELATRHGVPLLVDEVSYWKVKKGTPFDRLVRTWRHHVPGVFVTTQLLVRDVTETLFGCAPLVSVFRIKIPTEYHRAIRWRGIDPDHVATLRDRECEVHQL